MLLKILERWFEGEEWGTEPGSEPGILRAGFIGKNGEIAVYARALEEARQVLVYSRAPFNVPEDKRAAVAELLTRANYGLLIGNFEMDYSDGEVRYKTSIDVEGGDLDPRIVKHLVYPNVLTMDRYLPAIGQVVYADASPAEAVARVEG